MCWCQNRELPALRLCFPAALESREPEDILVPSSCGGRRSCPAPSTCSAGLCSTGTVPCRCSGERCTWSPNQGWDPGCGWGHPDHSAGGEWVGAASLPPGDNGKQPGGGQALLYLRVWWAGEQPGQVRCAEPLFSVLSRRLQWCQLSESCCAELAALLAEHPGLAQLELADSSLGDSGVRLLCEGLRAPGCRLRILR